MDSSGSPLDRLVALVRRELAASDVRVLSATEAVPTAPNVITAKMHDSRIVVATFDDAPSDRTARERRLGILVDTFAQALSPDSDRFRAARVSVGTSLQEELRALAVRAAAADVIVIDVDSPVVWGSALGGSVPSNPPQAIEPLMDLSGPQLVSGANEGLSDGDLRADPEDGEEDPLLSEVVQAEASRRAIAFVRGLPYGTAAHKGRHFRHLMREDDFGYLAISFSGIYVLILVFGGDFDELRAERAAADALPRVERLVLALPPLDPEPEPTADVIAIRRPRRR